MSGGGWRRGLVMSMSGFVGASSCHVAVAGGRSGHVRKSLSKTSLPIVLSLIVCGLARAGDDRGPDYRTPGEQIPLFRNLVEMHVLTSGPYDYTHSYPTARTWSKDSNWIFVEGGGPGPDGVVRKNGRHLLMIDIATGKKRYLVSEEHPNPDNHAGSYMFDYAPAGNSIAYVDPTAHDIHLLNLDSMKSGLVLHEPDGTLGGPLSIAWDGTRIGYWAMFPSVANRFFDDYITVIFTIDVDPVACKATGEPRIAEAYPRRKLPGWDKNHRLGIHVNHVQINPKNKDHLVFSHEMLGAKPDGSVAMSRLWETMVDEDRKRRLIPQPAGLDFTHEVFAPDGKSLIFPYMLGVGQVFFDTLERRSLFYQPDCCPGHLTVSPDGKWIAGDTWGRWKNDKGKEQQTVMMIEVATRRFAHLCWFNQSHPHPNFSPDGRKIAFSFRDDHGHQQVAWIDVSDVQKSWDKLAQGVGAVASSQWR
jgi:hypothetical protein